MYDLSSILGLQLSPFIEHTHNKASTYLALMVLSAFDTAYRIKQDVVGLGGKAAGKAPCSVDTPSP